MNGSFLERPTDRHVGLRRALLDSGVPLPAPGLNTANVRTADFPDRVFQHVFPPLRKLGLSVVRLDEPLSDEQFIILASHLGNPIPELAPAVQPYVTREVILNLVSEHGHTVDPSLQPFATSFLTLHTEGSGRPIQEQPRYIVLMCCDPGDSAVAAQTVLVPMDSVDRRLNAGQIALLAQTRYSQSENSPWLVRDFCGRRVFSFRDFYEEPLNWAFAGCVQDAQAINDAILSLLAAMYSADDASGVQWVRGLLVVIDNTFFFHGRTAGRAETSTRHRHLKRLRITFAE